MWRDMKWRRISEINVPATLSLIYYHFGDEKQGKYYETKYKVFFNKIGQP